MAEPVIIPEQRRVTPPLSDLQRFQQAQREDVLLQRGQGEFPDVKSSFEGIMSSTTMEEIRSKGVPTIGGIPLTPTSIAEINKSPGRRQKLFRQYEAEYSVPQISEGQVGVGFSGPDYTGERLPPQFRDDPIYLEYLKQQQEVALLMQKSNIPVRGQRIILDDWANSYYGNTLSEYGRELRDIPASGIQGLPSIFAMGTSALTAMVDAGLDVSVRGYEDSFSDRFSSRYNEQMQSFYGGMGGFNIKMLESTGEGNQFIGNSRQRFTEWYKNKYIEKHGEDAWVSDHNFAEKINIEYDDKGNAIGLKVATDDDGNIVYDEVVDPEVIDALIKASWDELSTVEKASAFFGVNAPFMVGAVARSTAKGIAKAGKIKEARQQNPGKYAGMNDYEVWENLYDESKNGLFVAWRKAYAKIPFFGKRQGYKSEIDAGNVMLDHRNTIEFYNKRIEDLTDEAKVLQNKPSLTEAEQRNLTTLLDDIKSTKVSYNRYRKQSSGSGILLNPYTKGVLFDEVAISGAMAIGEDYLAPALVDLEVPSGVASVLTTFAFPLVAPVGVRKLREGAVGLAARTPVVGFGVQGIQQLGDLLSSSESLSKIGMQTILRSDITEIRNIAEREGIALSENDINSIQDFRKIMKSVGNEVITVGGVPETLQDRMINSFRGYADNMGRQRKRLETMVDREGNLVFSEEEVNSMMSSLHLSIAHSSGFAPLIQAAKMLADTRQNAAKFLSSKTADELFRTVANSEAALRGMSVHLQVLRTSFASKGIELDTNDPIGSAIIKLEQGYEAGMEGIELKKQALSKLIDMYSKDPNSVDENTVEQLVNLKMMLEPEELQTVARQAEVADDIAGQIMEGFRDKQIALSRLDMSDSDFDIAIGRQADVIFDVAVGLRKDRASAFYNDVEKYETQNNIQIGLEPLVEKFAQLSEDFVTVGGSRYAFGGGREFINKGGKDLAGVFESAAKRGMIEEYGDAASTMVEVLFENGEISNLSYTEAALLMAEKAGDTMGLRFFRTNTKEVEEIRRTFAYLEAYSGKATDPRRKSAATVFEDFKDATDEALLRADPSKELLKKTQTARNNYKREVGDVLDSSAYGGRVLKNRARKLEEAVEGQPRRRKYLYKNKIDTPEQGFRRIGSLARKIALEKDPNKIKEYMLEVKQHQRDLMSLYGLGFDSTGRPVFDLSNPDEAKIANGMASLINTVVSREVSQAFSTKLGPMARQEEISKLPSELQGPVQRATEKLKKAQQEIAPFFDLQSAHNILELEKGLAVITRDKNGVVETRLPLSTELRDMLLPVDEMLETNKQYQDAYKMLQEQTVDTSSRLYQAGQATMRSQERALNKLQRMTGLANDSEKFFNTYLENATPEMLDNHKKTLMLGGMTADEADLTLKEMYIRGLMTKSGVKTKSMPGFSGDAVKEITDIDTLIDYTKDPAKRQVMVRILGEDHAKHLEDIADWANVATGNGAGLRSYVSQPMSLESKIARLFNLARRMVSPAYVGVEVGIRVMALQRQKTMEFLLNNKNASMVISKALNNPASVSRDDIKLLGFEIRGHIMLEVLKSGTPVSTLDTLLGNQLPVGASAIGEAEQQDIMKQFQAVATETQGETEDEQTD